MRFAEQCFAKFFSGAFLQEAYLLIEGRVQVAEGAIHVNAARIEGLATGSHAHAGSHDSH